MIGFCFKLIIVYDKSYEKFLIYVVYCGGMVMKEKIENNKRFKLMEILELFQKVWMGKKEKFKKERKFKVIRDKIQKGDIILRWKRKI